MLIVAKIVKAHVHSLGRQINGEALPALNEVVRMIVEDATIHHHLGRRKVAKAEGRTP